MNKNQFRIIFNKTRGLMMAVAECVKSHGSGRKAGSSNLVSPELNSINQLPQTATIRPVIFSVMLSLGLVGMVPDVLADVIADPGAPVNQRPIILTAPNNVPVVNIQTPTAAGVSHNTYQQFDVNSNGVILNNSRGNVQTQLGGYIQGNPYLATGTARIILNEVNSSNPSYLNGYVEVAGSKAQVVIANPAGISCSGCGFINANRVTLTTGAPILNAGSLSGYIVGGGQIEFLGTGLDTSQVNYTDVIARAVSVNAGIYAQNLNIITGSNQVIVDASGNIGGASPISASATLPNGSSNPVPGYAIDVAALGGMYAGKIYMTANEAGVGVRNAGNIGATAGEFSLTADGQIINTGRISASTDVTLSTANGIQNQGTISAQNNASITTQADVQNNGIISAARELVVNASSSALDNSQGVISAQRLELHAASLTNTQGDIEQTGSQALSLNATGISNTNGGIIGNLPLSSGSGSGSGSGGSGSSGSGLGGTTPPSTATSGGSTTVVAVAPVVLADGVIDSAGQVNNDAGQIIANGNFDVTAGTAATHNGLTNTSTINVHNLNVTGTTFSNIGGSINAQQAQINTASIDNTNGQVVAQDSITAVTDQLTNAQGRIESGDSLTLTATTNLNNNAGSIKAGGELQINSNSVVNTNTSSTDLGIQGGSVTINSDQIDNTQGQILANQSLSLTGHGNLNNSQGTISALAAVTVQDSDLANKTQNITNTSGAIEAGTQLTIASNSLTGDGSVFSNSDLNVSLNQDYTHGATATLSTNGNLTFTTQGNLTNQGELAAGQAITVNAANIDNAANATITGQNAYITASNALNNRGVVDGGDTFINANTLNNIGTGRIYGDHLAIAAPTINNIDETINGLTQAGTIAARNQLDIGTSTLTNREHGLIFSAGDIAIGGSLDANHHATVDQGQSQATVLNNNSATIEALGNVSLNVGQINNTNEHITTQVVRTSDASTIASSVDVRGNIGSPAPAVGNIRQYQMSYFSTDGPLFYSVAYITTMTLITSIWMAMDLCTWYLKPV